jgi:hypothetical protein
MQFASIEEIARKAVDGWPVVHHGLTGAMATPALVCGYALVLSRHEAGVDFCASEVRGSAGIIGFAGVQLLSLEACENRCGLRF